jgi:hypothetical protein
MKYEKKIVSPATFRPPPWRKHITARKLSEIKVEASESIHWGQFSFEFM